MKLESAQDNRLTVSLELGKTLAAGPRQGMAAGALHSGVVASILDTSASLAIMLRLGRLIRVQTLDMRADYLRTLPAEGTLYCRATCYRYAEQMAFVRAAAFTTGEDGREDKVAKANASFLVIHQQRVPV